MVQSMLKLTSPLVLSDCYMYVFHVIGELSLEEFVAGARSDEEFMGVMMKSLDLSHIVAMIHSRRHSI